MFSKCHWECASMEFEPIKEGTYVLVIDDDVHAQRVYEYLLMELHCRVDLAKSGSEAIKFIEKISSYDLILLDANLPDISGKDLLMRIRASESENRRIPAIVITGYAEKEIQSQFLIAGANDFIIKPVDKEKLAYILYKYANQR